MKKTLILFCCISVTAFARPETALDRFKPQKNHALLGFDKLKISLVSTFGNWKQGVFRNIQFERLENSLQMKTEVSFPEAKGNYALSIVSPDDSTFKFDVKGTVPETIKPGLQYLQFTIPLEEVNSVSVAGKGKEEPVDIPEKKGKSARLLETWHSDRCSLLLNNGDRFIFSGYQTMLYIQDNRHWNRKDLTIRFWLGRTEKTFTLSLVMNYQKNTGIPVAFGSRANSFRADDIADDKKGGWTDQGKSNDLRMLKAGSYHYKNVAFDVAPEDKGSRPSTIVLAGSKRNFAPAEIDLPLPENHAGGIALLHCSAWTPKTLLGEMDIIYKETGIQTIPVVGGRDVGNWWGGTEHPNARLVWKSSNAQMPVGIHASFFSLNGRSARSIRFRVMNPGAVWMILGLTLLENPVKLEQKQSKPLVTKADANWLPVDFSLKTLPGSPMDFSFINRELAPAGKWGRVITAPEGHLGFEQDKDRRLRLYGTNLCSTACFMEKKDADRLTDYFLSMGINTLRFHHHDTLLIKSSGGKMELDPVNVDRLDYLIAQCKRKGIYITTDLYTSRHLRPGELKEVREKYPQEPTKRLIQATDDGLENWKTFARLWLTHRNPYTGQSLAEDPVLVLINLVNEDTLSYNWNNCLPVVDAYKKYAKEKGIKPIRTEVGDPQFGKFLYEFQVRYLKRMAYFVKNDLKAKCMLTSCNFGGNIVTTMIRNQFDAADDHMYVAHPAFPKNPWELPHTYPQNSTLPREAPVPGCLFPGIIYGKPFFITELNFCAPNRCRSEGALLTGAYCALQDVSGIYRFNFSGSLKRILSDRQQIAPFESVFDPIMQISDRIIAAMFLRRDVRSSDYKISYTIPDGFFDEQRDSGYPWVRSLGLIARIGAVFEGHPYPGTFDYRKLPPEINALYERFNQEKIAVSSTREITLNVPRGILTVATPRSAAITIPQGKSATAGVLSVSSPDCFQTIAAISRDAQPLTESNDIIVFQLTNVCSAGERYGDEERTLLEKYGSGPLLLLRGKAEISLHRNSRAKVYALNLEGKVLGEIKSRCADGNLKFTADTGAFPGGVFGYSIRP